MAGLGRAGLGWAALEMLTSSNEGLPNHTKEALQGGNKNKDVIK
jgi:hypothetical protein